MPGSQDSSSAKAPLHPWVWPTVSRQRIHLDFLGRSFHGKDAVGGDRLPLQMARGFGNEFYNSHQDHNSIEGDVCTLWPSGVCCDRQWTAIHIDGVKAVPDSKWSQAHPLLSISPTSNGDAERLVQAMKQALWVPGGSIV